MALRAAAWRARQDAAAQANVSVGRPFLADAVRYEAQAEKVERARVGAMPPN